MRLLPRIPAVSKEPPQQHPKPAERVSGAAGNGQPSPAKTKGEKEAAAEPVAPAVPPIDYTRPTNTTELLLDLQQRLIALEELAYRKLTSSEWAIAIEATTGLSLDQWAQNGYVAAKCPCTKTRCKGWMFTPIEHHRTAPKPVATDSSPVKASELTDVSHKELTPDYAATFKQMFKDGKLSKKGEATLIPKDGPITWTHDEQLAFVHGFEMEELLEYAGKPRELQRRLIAALREAGYNILSAPEKSKGA